MLMHNVERIFILHRRNMGVGPGLLILSIAELNIPGTLRPPRINMVASDSLKHA